MKPKTPPELTEWIEAYLRQDLSEEDLQLFKQEMAINSDFAAEVEFMELTHALLDDLVLEDDLRQIHAAKVQEWHEDEVRQFQPSYAVRTSERPSAEAMIFPLHRPPLAERGAIPLWGRSAAAAAVAGVALVGYLSLSPIRVTDDLRMTTRSGTADSRDHAGQYCYDSFYTGKKLLEANHPQEAIPHLERVARCQVRPYFKDATQWYLTVAYLESKQEEKAGATLTRIEQNPSYQYAIKPTDRWKTWWRLRLSKLR